MDSNNPTFAQGKRIEQPETDGRGLLKSSVLHAEHPLPQTKILDFLGKPSSYGLTEPVDRIDMVQWVLFMAGPFCLKLRRHQPLGQTGLLGLEQRKELALKELRLGMLFAPDLYLDLVPVRSRDGVPYLDLPRGDVYMGRSKRCLYQEMSDGPVLDWLVLMRRYDFSKSYDKQVELYQPNFADCHQLADLVASGYELEKHSNATASWLAHLEEVLDGLSDISRNLDRVSKQTTLRSCLARARDQLDRSRSVITSRGSRGLIGQIHGNLRLSNVVALPHGLQMVNPQVSHKSVHIRNWVGDPFFDLASLITEMWSRGLTRQANWVLSHYCNRQLDSHALDGLKVMDLYLFIQALDRARLQASAISRDTHTTSPDGTQTLKNQSLDGYAKTARDCLLQDEASLVVVGGSNRANRSHLSRLLAPAIGRMPGAIYISSEEELLTLYEVDTADALPLSAYRQSVWRLVYRRMTDKARMAIDAGYSVILEGLFDKPDCRVPLTSLAKDLAPSVPIVAFHLFDPLADALHSSPQATKRLANSDLEVVTEAGLSLRPDESDVNLLGGPIFGNRDSDEDWTRWIELDASRSVGDLLSQVLSHMDPVWTPLSENTLH